MESNQKVPGYKIIICIAVIALFAFGAFQIASMHKTPFEKVTGFKDFEEMIASKIAYEERVAQSIQSLGGPGDDFTKAKNGDAAAQYRLGNVYLYGTQFEKQDYAEAMRWFRQSADQKYAPAQYQLGRMYASGFNTPEDKKEAVKWYLMSAEGGYKWAQIHLGELYMHFMAEQFGVKRDFNQAFYWLSLGTTTEEPSSDFVRDRDEAAGHLKPDEVETVKQRVDAWRAAHVPAAN